MYTTAVHMTTELEEYQSQCCVNDGTVHCQRPVFVKSCSAWWKRPLCKMHYTRILRHGAPGCVGSRWRQEKKLRDRRGRELATRLDRWRHTYGDVWRIRRITLPIANLSIKSAWIAQHKSACGPRQGAHPDTAHDNTIRAWQERGWIHLEQIDTVTYEVTWVGGYHK